MGHFNPVCVPKFTHVSQRNFMDSYGTYGVSEAILNDKGIYIKWTSHELLIWPNNISQTWVKRAYSVG